MNLVTLSLCTYLAFDTFERNLAVRVFATLTLISAFTAVSIRQIYKQQILLHHMAITDSLTGLYNRNALKTVVDAIIDNHHKLDENCHLLTLDLDHFKNINDQYGHDIGDTMLTKVAHKIRDLVGDQGVVFRHGGEEFIAVIEQESWQNTKKLAEKIRVAIENIEVIPGRNTTISIGLSKLKPKMTRIDWIKESDRNLLIAKKEGRNQIIAS